MWMNLSWQVGALLEHTVGHIDPLHLVNKVPAGMHIPRLVPGLLITKIDTLHLLVTIQIFLFPCLKISRSMLFKP